MIQQTKKLQRWQWAPIIVLESTTLPITGLLVTYYAGGEPFNAVRVGEVWALVALPAALIILRAEAIVWLLLCCRGYRSDRVKLVSFIAWNILVLFWLAEVPRQYAPEIANYSERTTNDANACEQVNKAR